MTNIIGQDKPSLEDVLEHHGVKGMKWGVRRADGGEISSGTHKRMVKAENHFQEKRAAANAKAQEDTSRGLKGTKHQIEAGKLNAQHHRNQVALKSQGLQVYKNPNAKLTRDEVKAEKNDFYQKKLAHVVETAAKNPNTLVYLRTQQGDSIVTGKEFLQHATNGGIMNAKYTDIYAQQHGGKGPLVFNQNMNARFVRSDKRK